MNDHELYQQIGEEGITRLVGAFYEQVPLDDILGSMYPSDDLEGAEERLRDFLLFRFGGIPKYLETRGRPALKSRHIRFPIDKLSRDRWLKLMTIAIESAQLPRSARDHLREFFAVLSTSLINRRGDGIDSRND